MTIVYKFSKFQGSTNYSKNSSTLNKKSVARPSQEFLKFAAQPLKSNFVFWFTYKTFKAELQLLKSYNHLTQAQLFIDELEGRLKFLFFMLNIVFSHIYGKIDKPPKNNLGC